MEGDKTTSKKGAESFVALSKFFHEAKTKCFDSCVLDFQNDNIGAMEKEWTKAWLKKHLTIYRDLKEKFTH